MSRQNLQVPNYFESGNGEFPLAYHTDMIRDELRVSSFEKAINLCVYDGANVLDIGCGTGIFSILAAKKGGQVTVIEADPNIAKIAKENFLSNQIDVNFIEGNILDSGVQSQLSRKFDIVISETMSIWCIDEPQVLISNLAKKEWLNPSGVLLPNKVTNLMCLCDFQFGNGIVECKVPVAKFTGIKDPLVVSETKRVDVLDLNKDLGVERNGSCEFQALVSGTVNSLLLSSIVEIARGVNFFSSDTLMPQTIIPLVSPIEIEEGDNLKVSFSYKFRSPIETAVFMVEKMR